jgi:hypothetical protein
MIPRTSQPEFRASIVAAEMTEFIPGAGPPPHKIPSLTLPSSQRRGDPAIPFEPTVALERLADNQAARLEHGLIAFA